MRHQVMKPPTHFETHRLILRPPVLEDASTIFEEYAQDPEVTRYLVWRPHPSIEDTQTFLRRCIEAWSKDSAFPWAIAHKETKRLIGMIELRMEQFKADLGYVLGRGHWGQGYMTEAVQEVIRWALQQDRIYRVWAVCDVENKASIRVLEKVGMNLEGTLRRWIIHPNLANEPRNCCCYAIAK